METTAVPNSFHITEASYTVTVNVPPHNTTTDNVHKDVSIL